MYDDEYRLSRATEQNGLGDWLLSKIRQEISCAYVSQAVYSRGTGRIEMEYPKNGQLKFFHYHPDTKEHQKEC